AAPSPARNATRSSQMGRICPNWSYHRSCRPGDRGPSRKAGLEESPDTAGQDAGGTQAAKADGKWNRKETAGRGQLTPVRVKRWGKSPPAVVATRPARQTPSGARRT